MNILLQMSVSAGVLILLTAVVRAFAINRLPKTMFVALWGIAIGRLIVPFSIPSKIGISGLIHRIGEVFGLKGPAINAAWDADAVFYRSMDYMNVVYKPLRMELLMILWLAGAGLLALLFAVSFYKSHREIKTALPVRGNVLIDKWLSGRKTNRPIEVLVSDKITTPLTYGILKPKIILPKSMDFSNEPQLGYVLTHEYIHIRRFDALWKLVMITALCCHWFNPTVWLLYLLMNRDLELACDERVVKLFGESARSDYALSLIEMAEQRSKFAPLYSSFSKNATEERIVSIMKFKKTSVLSLVLAFILVAGAASVFAESTADTVLRLHGVLRTDSGVFSFDIDEKGIVTVKDADGKVVSTTAVDSDGKAVLTDGSGRVIKELQLHIPGYKSADGEPFKIYGAAMLAGKDEADVKNGIGPGGGMPPKYILEVGGKGSVIVRDTEGQIIAAGTADSSGMAILTDSNGVKVGTAVVTDGTVVKLNININKKEDKGLFFSTY
jgi:bla regulator protein BlaR1